MSLYLEVGSTVASNVPPALLLDICTSVCQYRIFHF